MAKFPTWGLHDLGQSLWYDNISRTLLDNGELKRLIVEYGVRGLTSNPAIFDKAISKSNVYDAAIASLKAQNSDPAFIFEELAIRDVGDAADLLRPVFEESEGNDGYVSIEVSPLLATDVQGTVTEARRLFKRLARPNIMIKVPGTKEGLGAVQTLLEEGINVNITLLFSEENYVSVAQTYCRALRARAAKGLDVNRIRSVASFFVSRVDSIIDERLKKIVEQNKQQDPQKAETANRLLGKFGVANSRIAYRRFEEIFRSDAFSDLRSRGAAVQRPLWASTSTKNPSFRDVIYIEQLIGSDTVNTVPHETLFAFADHGVVAQTVDKGVDEAFAIEKEITAVGVDIPAALNYLQEDGVKKFADSFHALTASIKAKLA